MLSLVQKEFYYPTFGDDKLFTENSVTAVTKGGSMVELRNCITFKRLQERNNG